MSRSRSRSRTQKTAPAPAKKGGSGNPDLLSYYYIVFSTAVVPAWEQGCRPSLSRHISAATYPAHHHITSHEEYTTTTTTTTAAATKWTHHISAATYPAHHHTTSYHMRNRRRRRRRQRQQNKNNTTRSRNNDVCSTKNISKPCQMFQVSKNRLRLRYFFLFSRGTKMRPDPHHCDVFRWPQIRIFDTLMPDRSIVASSWMPIPFRMILKHNCGDEFSTVSWTFFSFVPDGSSLEEKKTESKSWPVLKTIFFFF